MCQAVLIRYVCLLVLLRSAHSRSGEVCFPFGDNAPTVGQPSAANQGRPGKSGPAGPPGLKGEQGPPGTCQCDEAEIQNLRDQLRILQDTVTQLIENVTAISPSSTKRVAGEADRCLVPELPEFSSVSSSAETLPVGSNITFTCDEGYTVAGSDQVSYTVTCQNGGTWSELPRHCQALPAPGGCFLGMKDGRIRDNQITASSHHSNEWLPHFARLDRQLTSNSGGTWLPRYPNYRGAWLQVELRAPARVVGVVTQGHSLGTNWWVSGFKISHGNSSNHLRVIQANSGGDKIFEALPPDGNSHVTNSFPVAVTARHFRLIIESYSNDSPTLRMDYLTC